MCNENGEELFLETITGAAAPRKGKARAGSGRPGVAAAGRPRKLSAWTGVRFRQCGKWATEIRVPRTREKVWIGTFTSARQAALAYDAAVFCFFGERTPKSRKTNFPAAPRPDISEKTRLQLSVADVKVIAEKHARDVDALLPPVADADDSTASPDDLVMVAPAAPVAVDDAPSAGAGGPAPPDHCLYDDGDLLNEILRALDMEEDFQAEIDAESFLVSDEEYAQLISA